MLNKKKILTLASAGIALMAITGSVYAASSTTATTDTTSTQQKMGQHQHKGPFDNQELLTLLNIDANTLQQDLKDGKSLADIAAVQGVDEQKVIDLFMTQFSQHIDQEVQSGKLTQDEATQKKADMQTKAKEIVENKGGFGHGGPGGFRGHDGMGGPIGDAASVLGVDQQQLFTQLKAGKTLVQIAQDKGINEQDLIDKLLQKDKERITKMVEQTWQQKDHRPDNQPAESATTDTSSTN
ncbi:MAG TPA: hypothetical protein VJ824_11020 [Bacillota bacterium]|nr:hypothetical protein [Bacillota bacterium]